MFFNTLLIFMINLISIDRFNHINDLKWINRILVVKNDKKFDFYNKYDSYLKDFEERDFIIINIKGKNTFIKNTEMSKYFTKSVFEKINDLNDTKYLILIGKDGQVKNFYSSKIKIENIFYDVDRMPMRKHEMETRNQRDNF